MDNQKGEYRIKISVRNNLILKAIEDAGYESVAHFCRSNDITLARMHNMISLKIPPIGKQGEFCKVAKQTMEALCLCPTDLWTSEQLNMGISTNSREFSVEEDELFKLMTGGINNALDVDDPEKQIQHTYLKNSLNKAVASLTPREEEVLRLRFGLDDGDELTLEEVGHHFDVSRERIRQMERKAIRKLRHPSRADRLIEHTDPETIEEYRLLAMSRMHDPSNKGEVYE